MNPAGTAILERSPATFTCILFGTAGELPTGERSLPRTPDEDYDVILYKCRNTWTIWLRGEKLGEFETAAPALELADYLALMHSRPAWLLDESGYPLKPIERGTIH